MSVKFCKKNQLLSELLIIDGLWGVGKSVITELISVFDSMECWKINLPFDNIPHLYAKGSIEKDAATALIANIFDEITYSVSISRSVNFRYKDATSIFNHPKKYDYILRLLEHGGDDSLKKIGKNKMIIPIATHIAVSDNDLFFRALGERCKIIRCVRHPVLMIDHWANYIGRCQTDPREFTLKINYNGESIPFFAEGWENEYLKANDFERSIKSISLLTDSYNKNFDRMKKKYGEGSVLEISFEEAVKNTDSILSSISKFIGRDINNKVYKKVKKKQCLPRSTIDSGLGYASTEWKDRKIKEPDQVVINKRLNLIKNKIRSEYYDELIRLCSEYENR